jgi:transposase
MKTVTLKIDNSIYEKFCWLLAHFSKNEIQILEQADYISDDHYLRTIECMVDSIKEARAEPEQQGVTLDNLDW